MAWARTAAATRAISSAVSGSSGCVMRAASRALVVLLAVAAALLVGAPGAARPGRRLLCPTTVGGLPLSVAVPFSGTPRPVAGEDGELTVGSASSAPTAKASSPRPRSRSSGPPGRSSLWRHDDRRRPRHRRHRLHRSRRPLARRQAAPAHRNSRRRSRENRGRRRGRAGGRGSDRPRRRCAVRAARKRQGPQRRGAPVVSERVREPRQTAGGRPPPSDETTLDGPPARRPADLRHVSSSSKPTAPSPARAQVNWPPSLRSPTPRQHVAGDLALTGALRSGRQPARHDLAAIARRLAHQAERSTDERGCGPRCVDWCEDADLTCRDDDGDRSASAWTPTTAPRSASSCPTDDEPLRSTTASPPMSDDLPADRLAEVVEDVVLGRSSLVDARPTTDGTGRRGRPGRPRRGRSTATPSWRRCSSSRRSACCCTARWLPRSPPSSTVATLAAMADAGAEPRPA